MDNIAYIMASKQISAVKNLEVIANNVANLNTGGFKTDNLIFKQYMHTDKFDTTSMTAARSTLTNFEPGSLKATNRALDGAISGPGFFLINTPAGIRYTKAGHFNINSEGALINSQGHNVLSIDGQEIVFEDGDADPIIGDDGTVFVGDAVRGQIGMAEFDNLNDLRKLGNGLFVSKSEPTEPKNSLYVQGTLEESNVNSISQIAKLGSIEKEVNLTTHFINDNYNLQRSSFKSYSKVGG